MSYIGVVRVKRNEVIRLDGHSYGLVFTCRKVLIRYCLAGSAAQQVVGPERAKQVSQLHSKSCVARPVNSNVIPPRE
jgi:hypothetical protein